MTLAGSLLLGSYSACTPDLDKLSAEYGAGGRSGGATSSGGMTPSLGGTSFGGGGGGGELAGGEGGSVESGGKGSGGKSNKGGAPGLGGGPQAGMAGTGGCEDGLVLCPGQPECTDLNVGDADANTVNNCGACGVTCSVVNASGATCEAGGCRPACSAGFASCNAVTANDGCEVDIKTPSNCGACGHVCSNAGSTMLSCTDQHCAPMCASGYMDCTVDDGTKPDDGCESYVNGLTHCGNCTAFVVCEKSQVCNAGVCGAPQGVTKFSVNFVTEDVSMGALQNQRYADRFGVPPNLTNSTMTIRIYAPGATGGSINIYFSDGDFTAGNGIIVALSALAAGWNDVNVPIPPASGNFDPAVINQVNLEVTSQGGGPFTIPTIVYIDGIRTSNLLVNDTFDASLGSTNGTMVMSTQQAIAGSTLSWLTAIP